MAIYNLPPPHERLNVFFGDMFKEMRTAPPEAYGAFLVRAEEEFKRVGYRDKATGVENILIIRLDAIGDMILTSGFIREVRKNFPKARITLVVQPRVYSVVELCPYVNEVLTFDAFNSVKSYVELLERIALFCRDNLWRKRFSIAFSPRWHYDTLSTLLLLWLSGARERIGYGSNPLVESAQVDATDNFLLTKVIRLPQTDICDAKKNFYLLEAAGLKVNETHMELFYDAEDFRYAKELLENIPPSCKKVMLGIGAQEPCKRYPVEKYLIALRELAKKDLVFVIVGGQTDFEAATFIEQNMPRGKVLNLAGKTTLRQCEALAAQTDFYLGNDTGNMHMAAAEQIPVLVLYREAADSKDYLPNGLSGFCRFPPYQTKAVVLRPDRRLGDCAQLPPIYGGCHHREPHCITQITPQEIIAAFEKLEEL